MNDITNFVFDSYKTQCVVDLIHDSSGKENLFLKSRKTNESVHFAYVQGKGLVKSGPAGLIYDEDLLGRFISIRSGDIDAYKKYFSEYGFLFPTETNSYSSISIPELDSYVQRVRATIKLMSTLADKDNYEEMLHYAAFLAYADSIESCGYPVHKSEFRKLITEPCAYPSKDYTQEFFDEGYATIRDSVSTHYWNLSKSDYDTLISGNEINRIPGSFDPDFISLFHLYISNSDRIANQTKQAIDFFFRYQFEVGIFKHVSIQNVEYYSKPKYESFTDDMKEALRKVAKQLIADEINFFLNGIRMSYNAETMEPSWQIDSLLNALYFSIFYMEAGKIRYKTCQNERCTRNKEFQVSTTATTKKYCCFACEQAAAQRRRTLREKLHRDKI